MFAGVVSLFLVNNSFFNTLPILGRVLFFIYTLMKLTLPKRLFNPLFWDLLKTDTRFVLNYGGAGSGKSYTQTQLEIYKCLTTYQKTLIIRKVSTTLTDSVIALILQILEDWNLGGYFIYNKVEKRITFKNGSSIMAKGLDDPEKIKSISGVTRVWVEEASELEEQDLQQLNTRIRGKNLIKPQLTLTFNPITETHWIKKNFFDNETNHTTIFKTTYKNNNFIDEEYKNVLKEFKDSDFNHYRVYCLGDWGKTNLGGEFYKNFDGRKHVEDVEYDNSKNIFISFDENVTPYLSLLIAQITIKDNKNTVKIIEEIAIEDYNLEDVCREFSTRYRNHQGGLTITGDATSRKQDTKLKKGHNFYTLIMSHLAEFKPVLKVPVSNASVVMRANWINKLLFDDDNIKVRINTDSKKTINDMESTKIGKDGGKDKKVIKDKKRGISYQEFGHLSDTLDYLLCTIFAAEYSKWLNGGQTFKPRMKVRSTASY